MTAYGYGGGYTVRWRTQQEIVAEALANAGENVPEAIRDIAILSNLFAVRQWAVYDITGDCSRKSITPVVNRDRRREGLPALAAPQAPTPEQRAAALDLARRVLAGEVQDHRLNEFSLEHARNIVEMFAPAAEAAA